MNCSFKFWIGIGGLISTCAQATPNSVDMIFENPDCEVQTKDDRHDWAPYSEKIPKGTPIKAWPEGENASMTEFRLGELGPRIFLIMGVDGVIFGVVDRARASDLSIYDATTLDLGLSSKASIYPFQLEFEL